jgi:hypothetical protein
MAEAAGQFIIFITFKSLIMVTKIFIPIIMLTCIFINSGCSQRKYLELSEFKEPLGEWFEAGAAEIGPDNEKILVAIDGDGVFINGEEGRTEHLVTKEAHSDIQLELEFMISQGSNSGVYLQGRYEIQIFDSWGREDLSAQDCGAIYYRWDESTDVVFEGTPPPVNACKKPGEWQNLLIRFRAPRFNSEGEKINNAVFEEVTLNGITLHRNVEVTGPTRSSLDDIEEPTGPLMFQGSHGPVAYRNIRMIKL